MPRIVVLGEAVIDLFAEPGKSLEDTAALRPVPGGAPANVAVALGRLRADVGFIGKVGRDAFGELLQATLAKHNADIRYFTADPRAPTMLAVVAVPKPDEQQFILYSAANDLLDVAEVPTEYLETAQIFIYSSVTLTTRGRDSALKAAAHLKQLGKQVIFDVNLRPAIWPDLQEARKYIEAAVKTATILKVNQVELEFLTSTKSLKEGSRKLLEMGVQLCAVSLGGEGAYFSTGKASGQVPAFRVEVKNTTGSGDAFVAGLALKLSQLEPPISGLDAAQLQSIFRFANACGAIVATQEGAMSAELSLEAVEQLMHAQP